MPTKVATKFTALVTGLIPLLALCLQVALASLAAGDSVNKGFFDTFGEGA